MYNPNEMLKSIEDEDFTAFSASVKNEIVRKLKEHPLTRDRQSQYDKFKEIESLYSKVKISS